MTWLDALRPEVRSFLLSCGWTPRRRATDLLGRWERTLFAGGDYELSYVAREILLAFGGLSFPQSGPGVSVARASFVIDPTLAAGEADRFEELGATIGQPVCPIGECDGGYYFLAVAPSEDTYCIMDDAWKIGSNFATALNALVSGIRGDPVPL